MFQGFSHFLGFLYHFVLVKFATNRIRVKSKLCQVYNVNSFYISTVAFSVNNFVKNRN